MVGNTAHSPEADLREVLVARARASSDGRLVADIIGGLLAILVLATWHPRAWLPLGTAALCFVAFGGWGIADRELAEHEESAAHWRVLLLRGSRVASAVVGVTAAVGLLLQMLALALGTWIS